MQENEMQKVQEEVQEEIINSIFGYKRWKGKYIISWCELCDSATIRCDKCSGTSCNCKCCEECKDDFDDFNKNAKTSVYEYMTEDEIKVYQKSRRLRQLILESLGKDGEYSINFSKMKEDGKLTKYDMEHLEICK